MEVARDGLGGADLLLLPQFQNAMGLLKEERPELKQSEQMARHAARAAQERLRKVKEEEGFTSDKASEFLWTFLQHFSVSLEVTNLAVIVPFRNYSYYTRYESDDKTQPVSSDQYSLLAVTVDRFSLQGFAGSAPNGGKIIARADLAALRTGFGQNCDTVKVWERWPLRCSCLTSFRQVCARVSSGFSANAAHLQPGGAADQLR